MIETTRNTAPAVLILTPDEVEALGAIFESAERGREDFEYLARQDNGDYDELDVQEARAWHKRELALEEHLNKQLEARPAAGTYEDNQLEEIELVISLSPEQLMRVASGHPVTGSQESALGHPDALGLVTWAVVTPRPIKPS